MSVSVAALNLQGVGDVVWDVQVVNGRTPTPDVVWQRRISSTGYGDGAGSASYVGPCDADTDVSMNEVRVWVVGVYSGPVSALGSFASGAVNGAAGVPVPFQNPTALATPLTRKVACVQNADRPVQFDVALMRPADQGFFDIAVNFNNIFCSAKLDCCQENEAGTACADDLKLLFDAGGERATTIVLGFACTAGASSDVETELYLDAVKLDCTAPNTGEDFAADIEIDPTGAAGNQCSAGDVEGCGPLVTSPGVNADLYLYQVGVYRGFEELTSGETAARKVYWNVVLGAVREDGGVGIEDCWLKARATADDANVAGVTDNGAIAQGAIYPYIQWSAQLDGSCHAEQLSFGTPGAAVTTAYTEAGATSATTFAYGYGPSFGPAAFGQDTPEPCGLLGEPCPSGFTCDTTLDDATSYALDGAGGFCVSDGTVAAFGAGAEMVYVPAGTFWMGCNSVDLGGTDTVCEDTELPQHEVTQSAYAMDRVEVTAQAYWDWCGDDGFAVWTMPNDAPGSCLPPGRQGDVEAPYDYTYKPTTGEWTTQLYPVNGVNSYQAIAYCEARGKRLCTEAEWERAARGGCETVTGTCPTAMRRFPWGNTEPTCAEANIMLSGSFCENGVGAGNTRVAGASPYGALDLIGNVVEWLGDWFVSYPGATDPFDYTDSYRSIRGGSFEDGTWEVSEEHYLHAAMRNGMGPDAGDFYAGFRCCRSYP
ncbi:MAG: hypothetical protein CVU56_18365 [Deltaproteobacteria bacterium HGW-Deltaproteobacteria-14]|nr:MAG: hypothetical protein CVU56_18365 [Deltaproteobacteria bacterium HGW-Deltaproteobacteria-14]